MTTTRYSQVHVDNSQFTSSGRYSASNWGRGAAGCGDGRGAAGGGDGGGAAGGVTLGGRQGGALSVKRQLQL